MSILFSSAHAGVPPKGARRGRCLSSTDHINCKQPNPIGFIESPMAGVASRALAMTNTRPWRNLANARFRY